MEIISCSEQDVNGAIPLKYRVHASGDGGIGEIRIFNNGKMVYSDGKYTDIVSPSVNLKSSTLNQVNSQDNRGTFPVSTYDRKESVVERWIVLSPEKESLFEDEITIQTIPGDNEIGIIAFNSQNSLQSV